MKALFVMDMQEITVGENHAEMFNYPVDIVLKVNEVIEKSQDSIIVYIRNLMKDNFLNKFAPIKAFDGTEETKLVKNLAIKSDYCFKKYKGDAFSNSELCDFLKNKKVDTIEIIGVDGGGCVGLTAIGACKAGYKVILNTSAIGTIFENKRDKYYNKLRKLGAKFI